jgi:Xaa-Pro aminopeptidase
MVSSPFVYVNTGLNSLTPHLHPTGRRIERGDIVALNVFPVVSGYMIELERTLIFGRCTPEQEGVLRVIEEAFSAGKKAVAAGVRACDVDRVTREVREKYGFGEFTRGGTGHSHGILIGTNGREELGELRSYNTRPLQVAMVVSVEPGIYLPDVGAYRHSDVLVVTEHGSEVITEFQTPISVG